MTQFIPWDWYWIVGGSTTNVWSSKHAASVLVADQEYQDWLTAGYFPTPIASQAELEAVLATQFPAGSLKTYNPDARFRKASGGVIITSLSAVPFLSDPQSRNTVNSAYQYAAANPGHVTHWKMSDGSFVDLSVAQITTVNNNMTAFVQSCFTCESTTQAGIAGGTITTIAQVDAAYAAISNTFP